MYPVMRISRLACFRDYLSSKGCCSTTSLPCNFTGTSGKTLQRQTVRGRLDARDTSHVSSDLLLQACGTLMGGQDKNGLACRTTSPAYLHLGQSL